MIQYEPKPFDDSAKLVANQSRDLYGDYVVHYLAQNLPMMTQPELEELAKDIEANGQLSPCVIDDQQRLLDGRNRWVVCEYLGIEPLVEEFDPERHGPTPEAFIWSANIVRRQLSVAQRAQNFERCRKKFIESAVSAFLRNIFAHAIIFVFAIAHGIPIIAPA